MCRVAIILVCTIGTFPAGLCGAGCSGPQVGDKLPPFTMRRVLDDEGWQADRPGQGRRRQAAPHLLPARAEAGSRWRWPARC